MKKILLMLLMLSFCCCDKDNDNNQIILPASQLPPATQVGANTAGCLVDGEVFLPKGFFTFGSLQCNYTDGLNFSISIGERINDKIRSINLASLNQNLTVGQVYNLGAYGENSKYGEFTILMPDFTQVQFQTTETVIGELKITHHDFNNAILSGTFWYDAVNSVGEKVEIREGRFDMHY